MAPLACATPARADAVRRPHGCADRPDFCRWARPATHSGYCCIGACTPPAHQAEAAAECRAETAGIRGAWRLCSASARIRRQSLRRRWCLWATSGLGGRRGLLSVITLDRCLLLCAAAPMRWEPLRAIFSCWLLMRCTAAASNIATCTRCMPTASAHATLTMTCSLLSNLSARSSQVATSGDGEERTSASAASLRRR